MNKSLISPLVIVAIVLVAIGGVVLACFLGGVFTNSGDNTDETGSNLELDPSQGNYVPPTATGSGNGIAIPGWDSIAIPAGRNEVTVDFPNPIENSGKYYLTFELRLKDTDEVLYQSGLVEPGKHIQKIVLSRALEAGEYNAVIRVQPYTISDTPTATNNADVSTKLIVK